MFDLLMTLLFIGLAIGHLRVGNPILGIFPALLFLFWGLLLTWAPNVRPVTTLLTLATGIGLYWLRARWAERRFDQSVKATAAWLDAVDDQRQ